MAFPSQREKILENLVAALGTIDGTGLFQTTVKTVDRDPIHWQRVQPDGFPAVFVLPPDDPHEFKGFDRFRATFAIELLCYVREVSGEAIATTLEKFLHDVERAISLDGKRGGNAIFTQVVRIEVSTDFLKPFGIAVMHTAILYDHIREVP